MIEKQDVEFKREYNEKVNKTLLAFMNTDGGTLYLGLDDDGAVYGLVSEGVLVRVGSNTVMATRERIRQMIKDNGMGQFILELSIILNSETYYIYF